jgi:hypothetical protein
MPGSLGRWLRAAGYDASWRDGIAGRDLIRLARADLRRLLRHYAEAGAADRAAWQGRLMALDGLGACELVRLHGLLIVFGSVEQNTGHTPARLPGSVPAYYRATPAGIRALKLSLSGLAECNLDAASAVDGAGGAGQGGGGELPGPRHRERRKPQAARPVAAGTEDAEVPAKSQAGLVAITVG